MFASGVANWINDSLNGPKGAINLVDWATVAFTMGSTFLKAIGAYMIQQFGAPIEKILSSELMLISSGKQLTVAAKNIGVAIFNGILDGLASLADIDLAKIAEGGKNFLGISNVDPTGIKTKIDNALKDAVKGFHAKPFDMPPLMTKEEADKQAKGMMAKLHEAIQSSKPTPVQIPTEFAVTKSPELTKLLANANVNVQEASKKNPAKITITGDTSPLWAAVTSTSDKIMKKSGKMKVDADTTTAKSKADKLAKDVEDKKPKMKITGDFTDLGPVLKSAAKSVTDKKPQIQIGGDNSTAMKIANKTVENINKKKATITIQAQIKKMGSANLWNLAVGHAQHGMHLNRLKQDTIIQAHKGEYVHIDKPGKKEKVRSISNSGGGGGGGPVGKGLYRIRIEMQEQLKDFIRAVVVEDMGTAH